MAKSECTAKVTLICWWPLTHLKPIVLTILLRHSGSGYFLKCFDKLENIEEGVIISISHLRTTVLLSLSRWILKKRGIASLGFKGNPTRLLLTWQSLKLHSQQQLWNNPPLCRLMGRAVKVPLRQPMFSRHWRGG